MYVGKDFDPADPSETNEPYTFDFVNDVVAGETLVSAVWTCVVAPDSRVPDANPSSHIVGSSSVSGTKTSMTFASFLPGVKYLLKAVVATTLNSTPALHSHVLCSAPK
jgi:hypothetical protein